MELFSADATMIWKKKGYFFPQKVGKNHHQKLLRKPQIYFFPYFLSCPTAQAEEFVFQNVTYRTTVYRAGTYMNKKKIHVAT